MALIGVKVALICVEMAWIDGEMVPGVCLACQELTGTLHSHVDVGVAFCRLVEAWGELSLCDKTPPQRNTNINQSRCVSTCVGVWQGAGYREGGEGWRNRIHITFIDLMHCMNFKP